MKLVTYRVFLHKPKRPERPKVCIYVRAKNAIEAIRAVDMYTGNYPCIEANAAKAEGEILYGAVRSDL